MKVLAISVLCVGSLGILGWQTPLPDLLTVDFAKLGAAKTLDVKYTLILNGDPQGKYELQLGKDRMFKLTQPTGFIVSDGQTVYTYTKATNTYTKTPLSDAELVKFEKRPEVLAWAPFFQKHPEDQIDQAVPGEEHTMSQHRVKDVGYTIKNSKDTVILMIDANAGVPRGFQVKSNKGEYRGVATDLDLGDAPAPADVFAFVAPSGATEAAAAASAPTFGQVEQLMTDNCLPCHNSANQKAGFDLTAYEGVVAACTPGDHANSLIIKALRGNGADQMPKGRAPLSEDNIKLIEQWIDNGAKRAQ